MTTRSTEQTSTLGAPKVGSGAGSGVQPVRMVVVDGPDRGAEAVLRQGTAFIGALPTCELVLSQDRTVSRRHASLELMGEQLRVRDLGSKNGTRYLGARVESVEVPLGSTIEVGQSRIALLPVATSKGALSERSELCGIHGRSAPMRRMFTEIETVAPSDAPVLVHGETGSGKEGIARAIHALSRRKDAPLVVFDCAAVHKELLQSALFGHVKGAFTGAVSDATGALEQAHGGTLFLDEIGELPLDLQPNLLRALETKTFARVGEQKVRKSDFRIVAATHRDLEAQARAGQFRMDLYFRLAAIVIEVPSLRERPEDIPLLAELFATQAAREKVTLSPSSLACLTAYSWPGNVRELRNTVERVVALGDEVLLPGQGGQPSQSPKDFHEARELALKNFERSYLTALLAKHGGSASAAAREAKIARSYFYRLLEEHHLIKGKKAKDQEE